MDEKADSISEMVKPADEFLYTQRTMKEENLATVEMNDLLGKIQTRLGNTRARSAKTATVSRDEKAMRHFLKMEKVWGKQNSRAKQILKKKDHETIYA